jgi:thiamine-phosphate pyrophosphorylase
VGRRGRRAGAALIGGARADVALAVGAAGVQLGHRSPPPERVRPWYRGWLGMSCHGSDDLRAAEAAGANHAVLSPVFGVPAKGAPLGVRRLAELAASTPLPVVALGGIDAGNAASLADSGVAGVAAIRGLRDAPDPASAASALASALPRRAVTAR